MKRFIFILSILATLLCSCTQRGPAKPMLEAPRHVELAALDTLMQSQPDSALYALLDFSSTHKSLAPFDRHYADLLLSEALFKNDCEQTARPALLDALNYFDSLAAAHPVNDDYTLLSARSHYMNGVGFMGSDSVVDACTEYLKALEIMEERFDEKELVGQKAKFMALTYNRLGDLLSDLLITDQALNCFRRALVFYGKCTTTHLQLSNALYQIGLHLHMLKQSDSAKYYYEAADSIFPDLSTLTNRDITASRALLLYETEHKVDESLRMLSEIASLAESEKELASRHLTMSEIFYKERNTEMAILYLDSVYNSRIDSIYKTQAAQYLKTIYTAKGDSLKVVQYSNYLSLFVIDGYEKRNTNSQLVELLNNHNQKTLVAKQDKRNKKNKSIWIKSILTLGLLLVVILLMVYNQKRKHQKEINEKENKLELEKQQHIALVNRMQNANARLREENQSLVSEINKDKKTAFKSDISDYEKLIKEPICCQLFKMFSENDIITTNPTSYYEKLSLKTKELNKFEKVIEQHCPDFINRVYGAYPDLEKSELKICQYFLIGLNEKQIAVLLQMNYSSIYRKSNRIKEKMKCMDIARHLKTLLFETSC